MKKVLSIFLSLLMVLSTLSAMPFAAHALDGEGTAKKPYKIGTAAELKEFRDLVNDGQRDICAVLTASIDLNNEEWTPIGYDYSNYSGTFDGQGFSITGLNAVSGTSESTCGFIGRCSGTVENLSVSGEVNSYTTSVDTIYVGGIVGYNYKGTVNNCCSNIKVVAETSADTIPHAGGVVGYNYKGKVTNCYNMGSVTASTSGSDSPMAGGIVCINFAGNVSYCYNTGTVTPSYGIVYNNASNGTITSCYYLDTSASSAMHRDSGTTTDSGALTAEQFKDKANFKNWDFNNVWYMGTDAPKLLYMGPASELETGVCFKMGMYPQTRVTDDDTITALAAIDCTMTSYGYLKKGGTVDMTYADIAYNGVAYRKVTITENRPYNTTSNPANTGQSANGYNAGETYYFKWEPVVWQVLAKEADGVYVMSKSLLDSQAYHNVYEDTTWENCTLRTWLNDGFYNAAFSEGEKDKIVSYTHENEDHPSYNTEGGNNTTDNLWVLSYSDAINTNFGFSSDKNNYDEARRAQGTDYAESQGLWVSTTNTYPGNSEWWLRTPGSNSNEACGVYNNGDSGIINIVYNTDVGIRPAFKFKLESTVSTSDMGTCRIVGHDWNAWTGTGAGTLTRTCKSCDAKQTESCNHSNMQETAAKSASCTEPGNNKYYYCPDCKSYLKADGTTVTTEDAETIPANGHDFDTVGYTADETHHWKSCAFCTAETERVKHNWGDASYNWKNNNTVCEAVHTCATCGKEVTEEVNTTSEVTTAATCTQKEETTFTATFTKDGFTTQTKKVETNDALGHSWEYTPVWAMNYLDGKTTYYAATAFYFCERDKNHVEKRDMQLSTDVQPATCTENGKVTYTAYISAANSVDGQEHTETEVVNEPAATGHSWNTAWSYDDTNHWHTCANCSEKKDVDTHGFGGWITVDGNTHKRVCTCGAEQTASHNWNTYWSTDDDYHWIECADCGAKKDEVAHDWDVVTTATCAEYGTTTYICNTCGKTVSKATGPFGHNYQVIQTVQPTCTEQGYSVYECTRCCDTYNGDYVDAQGHNYNGVVTKPTCTTKGYTTYTCTRCNDSYVADYTNALGHTYGTKGNARFTCTRCGKVDANKKTAATKADKAAAKKKEAAEKAVAKEKINAGVKGKTTSKAVTVYWGGVPKADRYVIYATYCNPKNKFKKIATVKGNVRKYDIKKLSGKALNKKRNVKAYIVAYRKVGGKYVKLAKSASLHIAGYETNFTNAKKITVKKKKVTLKKNKTAKIKATVVYENKKKQPIEHTAKLRYTTSNKNIATVDKNGKITAKKKGTTTIYVFANNGVATKVVVTVK